MNRQGQEAAEIEQLPQVPSKRLLPARAVRVPEGSLVGMPGLCISGIGDPKGGMFPISPSASRASEQVSRFCCSLISGVTD